MPYPYKAVDYVNLHFISWYSEEIGETALKRSDGD